MERKVELKVIISQKSGNQLEFLSQEIIDFHSTESVKSYCGEFELTLKGQKKEIRDSIEPKAEMQIWVGNKEGIPKIMAGYIDKIVTEKKENSEEIIKILGRTYDALLVDTKVSGKIIFERGYSQAVREILKDTPFKEGKVENSTGKGILIFRNISQMEVIKNITEENGWIFMIDHDKNYYYSPNMPQKSVATLEDKDIKSYKIVKE
jgi:prophage tail gpP-like protein